MINHHRSIYPALLGPALVGLCFGAALTAQVPPGTYAPVADDTVFSKANFTALGMYRAGATGKGIDQINFTKVPNVDGVGQWTVTLTVTDLSPTYGGSANGSDWVVMGQYDTNQTPHTFTPSTMANAMNDTSTAGHFSLMIDPKLGKFATVDRASGMWISYRSSTSAPFPAPIPITYAQGTPVPPSNYLDPAPAHVDGKLHFFYTDSSSRIIMRELKVARNASGTLASAEAQAVVAIITMTIRPHSPTPLVDQNGNAQGMLFAANVGSDSDIYLLPCLSANETPILSYDATGWQNNGGIVGGRIMFADYSSQTNEDNARVSRAAWLMGSNTPLGGTATMRCGVSNPGRPITPVLTTVALSYQLNNGVNSGFAIPGWNGLFGLNGPLDVFATLLSSDADETATWSAPVPNTAALSGVRVSVQGLSNVLFEKPTLTNTATLEFH